MAFIIIILILIIAGFSFYKFRLYKKHKKEKKSYAYATAVARINMHNKKFLSQEPFYDGWSVVKLNEERYAYLSENGAFLGNYIFASANPFNNGIAVANILNQGYCLLKADGSFLVPPSNSISKKRYITYLFDRYYLVSDTITINKKNTKSKGFIIRRDGTFLTNEPFDSYKDFSNGVFHVIKNNLTHEYDIYGNLVFEPYNEKKSLGDGYFKISRQRNSWGIYNSNENKLIIPCEFNQILYIPEYKSFIITSYGGEGIKSKYFIFDYNGKELFSDTGCSICFWGGKYYRILKYRKEGPHLIGIKSKEGKILVQPNFTGVWVKDDNFFVTSDGKRCGTVNHLGYSALEYDSYKLVHLTEWDFPERSFPDFSSKGDSKTLYSCNPSFIIVSKNGKFGVVDLNGDIIIPIMYEDIDTFEGENNTDNWYLIKKNGKLGLADLSGKITIPIEYDSIECKMDIGAEIPPTNNRIYYDPTFRDLKYEQFCKGKPRYFILTQGNHKYTVNYKNEPYTPKPTRQDIILQKYALTSEEQTLQQKENQINPNVVQSVNKITQTKYILFFDTETTGLPRNYNAPTSAINNWPRLVQLSWLLVDDNNNLISEKDIIIKPENFTIPSSASNFHGITTEIAIEKGIDLSSALSLFIEDVSKSKVCVGHNIDFDKKIIGCELYRKGLRDTIASVPSICTMQSTVNICKIPGDFGYKYPKLQELYKHLFGLSFVDAHNSLADVRATFQCYKELKLRNLI